MTTKTGSTDLLRVPDGPPLPLALTGRRFLVKSLCLSLAGCVSDLREDIILKQCKYIKDIVDVLSIFDSLRCLGLKQYANKYNKC